jgi:hypothetical protein
MSHPPLPDLTYDQAAFKASHNSYWKKPISQHLDWHVDRPHRRGCAGLELDLVQSQSGWFWAVSHMGGYDAAKRKDPLRAYLKDIQEWSDRVGADHPPITVMLDIKQLFLDVESFPEQFDRYISEFLDRGKLFTPGELIGDQPDLVRAVRDHGWPSLAELRGRFIFVLSGDETSKLFYSTWYPSERLCFADRGVSRGDVQEIDPLWLRRGTRVFLNFSCNLAKEVGEARLGAFLDTVAAVPGFVFREYVLNDRKDWDFARAHGVNVLATDKFEEEWSLISGEGQFGSA